MGVKFTIGIWPPSPHLPMECFIIPLPSFHFEAASLFQTKYLEIASCAVSLLNNIWVRVEHSLLQKLKSIAVQAVYRQDVNKMWG